MDGEVGIDMSLDVINSDNLILKELGFLFWEYKWGRKRFLFLKKNCF